jgi:hypothetical protein
MVLKKNKVLKIHEQFMFVYSKSHDHEYKHDEFMIWFRACNTNIIPQWIVVISENFTPRPNYRSGCNVVPRDYIETIYPDCKESACCKDNNKYKMLFISDDNERYKIEKLLAINDHSFSDRSPEEELALLQSRCDENTNKEINASGIHKILRGLVDLLRAQ